MYAKRNLITRAFQVAGGVALAALIGGVPAALAATETHAATLSVAVAAQADVAVLADGVDTYQLTVTNQGGAMLQGITLHVPIADGYQLAAASFSEEGAWVTSRGAGQATIRIEGMRGVGDTVSGTLSFVGPTASQGNALDERLTANWKTEEEEFSAQSNLPVSGVQPLAAAQAGQGYTLSSDIFAPGEPITFWYTSQAGVSTQLVVVDGMLCLQPAESDIEEITYNTYRNADSAGALNITMSAAGIPAGNYTLVAHGNWSDANAAVNIRLP